MTTNSQLTRHQIWRHARARFGVLNELQEHVAMKLVNIGSEGKILFTRGAINYLLGEIADAKKIEGIAVDQADQVLEELLRVALDQNKRRASTYRSHREFTHRGASFDSPRTKLISYSSLVRALQVYDCPKPWC